MQLLQRRTGWGKEVRIWFVLNLQLCLQQEPRDSKPHELDSSGDTARGKEHSIWYHTKPTMAPALGPRAGTYTVALSSRCADEVLESKATATMPSMTTIWCMLRLWINLAALDVSRVNVQISICESYLVDVHESLIVCQFLLNALHRWTVS